MRQVHSSDGITPRAPFVIMAGGVWDLGPHRGHLNLLWRAKQLGDLLIVGICTDEGAAAYKGQRPVQCYEERERFIRQLPFVDLTVRQESTDPTDLLEKYRPDVLVHGSDWTELLQGQETVERLGIRWHLLPYTPGVSTTLLRGRLEGGLEAVPKGGLEGGCTPSERAV